MLDLWYPPKPLITLEPSFIHRCFDETRGGVPYLTAEQRLDRLARKAERMRAARKAKKK